MTRVIPASSDLLTLPSMHTLTETIARLKAILTEKHLHLFAHIDHATEAQKVGLSLRPTQVVIFGNPDMGTSLMQSVQTIGLDLPLRVLGWEDKTGAVWLTYTEPSRLVRRYCIADREEVVGAISVSLAALAHAATPRY